MTRRKPHEYNWAKCEFDETLLTKHYTARSDDRGIRFVVIHHMVIPDRDPDTDDALDACYKVWQTREASAHYGVDGPFVRQFVWDKNEAWATGSNDGNDHGISIEHANLTLNKEGTANDYLISEETLATSARLVASLHKHHKLGRPRSATVRQHSVYFATACPGPFFNRIWDKYIKQCAKVYDAITDGRDGGTQSVDFEVPKDLSKGSGGSFTPLWTPTGKMSVEQIQEVVGVTVDGLYGQATKSAVARYQRTLGVAVDGKWGKATEAAHRRGKRKVGRGRLLTIGSRGRRVRNLQRGLNKAFPAYSRLGVDGIYGAQTAAVVREFQRRSGLSPDGIVGRRTRRALQKYGVKS